MRRVIIATLAAFAALTGIACESDPPTTTTRNHDTREPVAPNPGAQPPAPAADPMACNPGQDCDPKKYVLLRLSWIGERRGYVTVYIDGQKRSRLQTMKPERVDGPYWAGRWEQTFPLSGIKSIGFDWAPDAPGMQAQCTMYRDGYVVGKPQAVDHGPCATNWTVGT